MVADFLFNTHRYVHAIELYEEVISLLSLFAFKTELPVSHSKKDFDFYVSDLSNELKVTKKNLQSEHDQEKEASNEVQGKTSSLNFRDDGSVINNEEQRKIAFYKTLGSTFYSMSRYHVSIRYFEQAAAMIKATGNKPEEQRIYTNLAIVYNAACQYDKAFSFQEKALKLSQENGDVEGQLECYCSLGSLCNDRGQFDRAIGYYSKCLGRNNKRREAMVLNSIGNAYLANGQYDASISRYEESLEIDKRLMTPLERASPITTSAVRIIAWADMKLLSSIRSRLAREYNLLKRENCCQFPTTTWAVCIKLSVTTNCHWRITTKAST